MNLSLELFASHGLEERKGGLWERHMGLNVYRITNFSFQLGACFPWRRRFALRSVSPLTPATLHQAMRVTRGPNLSDWSELGDQRHLGAVMEGVRGAASGIGHRAGHFHWAGSRSLSRLPPFVS